MFTKRRPGDVASCYASSTLAERELGFKAEKSLTDMCKLASSCIYDILRLILFDRSGYVDMAIQESTRIFHTGHKLKPVSFIVRGQYLSCKRKVFCPLSIHTLDKALKVLVDVLTCCAFCNIPQTKEVFI